MTLRAAAIAGVAIALVVVACGGDGGGSIDDTSDLAIDDYLERVEVLAARQDELVTDFLDGEGFLISLREFTTGLEGITPPTEATVAHTEFAAATRQLIPVFEILTTGDFDLIEENFETETAANQRFNAACEGIHLLADEVELTLDIPVCGTREVVGAESASCSDVSRRFGASAAGKIAYSADGLFTMNSDGSNPVLVPGGSFDVSWSPDSTRVADVRFSPRGDIYLQNADGSGLCNLTNDPTSHAVFPDWSPDGTKLVFVKRQVDNDIFVINADGSGITRLTDNPNAEHSTVKWSPDGSQIMFVALADRQSDNSRTGELMIMEADGSNKTSLLQIAEHDGPVSWSPDGARILLLISGQLHVMNTDGTNLVRLTEGFSNTNLLSLPTWSPDSTRIAFSASVGSPPVLDIYLAHADGSGVANLTASPARSASPTWSPDGTQIAFQSGPEGPIDMFDIYVMQADGSEVTRLTHDGLASQPHWLPAPR